MLQIFFGTPQMDTTTPTILMLLLTMTANVIKCEDCLKPGIVIGPLNKTSLDECESRCKNDTKCTFYVYLNSTGQCGTR